MLEVHPNLRVTKMAQYDHLTQRCLSLARAFKETGKPQLTRTFMNADGEHTIVMVTPRLLHTLANIRDRAFADYMLEQKGE